ncbi:DUF6602 domain-containing protein [Luteolibacter soli]|uniref:DUF6602 domain-containing protein n=1 Tax=Luteolibacter soli TaxID=3135280 RepID=A0ABU9AS95_9BACT
MDPKFHFESLTQELESLKNRVRHFIDHRHPPTDGEWKESVLRSMLAQRLPDTVKVGRGFILRRDQPSSQCDVLLYRSDHPIPFCDGDCVFISEDAVLGVIEVKTRLDKDEFRQALGKLADIGAAFTRRGELPILGLFSYEKQGDARKWFSEIIPRICDTSLRKVDLVSVGCDHFAKWWQHDPSTAAPTNTTNRHAYAKWHSYTLRRMAAGYFIANVIDIVTGGLASRNDSIWFPGEGKEEIGQRQIINPEFNPNP